MPLPQLIAHRGYALHYPENTLVGVEAAIAAGARYVEVDVQLSADREPFLFHDRTLDRVCGVSGAVHQLPASRLQTLHAREFDRFGYRFAQVPLAHLGDLRRTLERHPEITAFVEVKRIALEQFGQDTVLVAIARELLPVASQCVLISFSLELLLAARAYAQHSEPGWHAIGAAIERWRERKAALRRVAPEYLFCDIAGLPRFGRLRAGGAHVAIYEVDDPAVALRVAARGAALVETFAIGEMCAALALAQGASD